MVLRNGEAELEGWAGMSVIGIGLTQEELPQVTLMGDGEQAKEVIKLAKIHQTPVILNSSIVDLLCDLEIDELVPDDLYWVLMVVVKEIERRFGIGLY